MKIGLITIYHVPNYGSVLQTFATQKVLEQMGHECIVIQYNYRNDDFFAKQGLKRNRLREWILNNIPFLKSGKLNRFRKNHLNFSRKFETYNELEAFDWSSFDSFIVGSDQVWNTKYLLGDPAFLLKFAPSNKSRISLSSSFAMKSLPLEFQNLFRSELMKFKSISVRERNGVDIIQKELEISKDVEITLDPTLLLSRKEWLSCVPRSSFKKNRPYILVYMWTYAFEPRPYIFQVIEHYQKQMSAEVVVLEGHRELQGLRCPFVDANRSSVQEFIDLFANAELVITSSFHGTAFAVNFGIPLISIVPNGDGDDRQSSLLRLVGADNSIVKLGDNINDLNPYFNKGKVCERLEQENRKTKDWLNKALKE